MNKLNLRRIKLLTLNYSRNVIILFIVVLTYFYCKPNIVLCEIEIPLELLEDIKKELYVSLKDLIKEPNFIDEYGRSKIKPQFLTWYYTYIICSDNYLHKFIENLQLKEMLYNNKDNTAESINKHILELFLEYVKQTQSEFEDDIKKCLGQILSIKSLLLVKEVYLLRKHLFNLHGDIITPIADVKYHWLAKKTLKLLAYAVAWYYLGYAISK